MIRVFPRRTKWIPTDELAFVGDPPMMRPIDQPVRVSVTFTWDKAEGERLAWAWAQCYSDVQLGGPAFNDLGAEFIPSQFVKQGITITSRGCPWHCPWCFVPNREGSIREYPIKDGWIVQDNNLLGCSRSHIEDVFDMLSHQSHGASLNGGLDVRLLKQWHIDLLKSIRISELWFACDEVASLPVIERAADLVSDFPRSKKRCFVMIGYNGEALRDAEARLERVYELGFDPFSQLYQPEQRLDYPATWRALNRKWSRPAAYRASKAQHNPSFKPMNGLTNYCTELLRR